MGLDRPIVFVGGVPGAGKSHLSQQIARSVSGLHHAVAGRLIRDAIAGPASEYLRPPVPNSNDADRFQEVLVQEFSRVRREHVAGPLLLDGHYVVPAEDGPSPVHVAVFKRLELTGLCLVEAEPDLVARRLRQRPPVAWWDGSLDAIAALVELERRQAHLVARELGLPLVVVGGEEPASAASVLFGGPAT